MSEKPLKVSQIIKNEVPIKSVEESLNLREIHKQFKDILSFGNGENVYLVDVLERLNMLPTYCKNSESA